MSTGSEHRPARWDAKTARRARIIWAVAVFGFNGALIVWAAYSAISSSGGSGTVAGTAAARTAVPSVGGTAVAQRGTALPTRPPSVLPAGSTASRPLTVTSVAAFGPEGTSDGDNPGIASRILDGSPGQPWYSQWYATPGFGSLRSGTGLLLDMGETATVRDVRLQLGGAPGTDVQLRVGNSPSVDLPVVASVSDADGAVRLTATGGAAGRYVLIWFTRLPPDGHGHYQVSVYSAVVYG